MGVYKDKNRGNWYVSYRYVDSFGNRKENITEASEQGLKLRLGKEKTG